MQDRVVALLDMDCFYCQVEVRLNPQLKGKPVAVVQYNTWKGGGIIAVNYEARALGVTRFMRGDDAQKHCPTLELAAVPEVRGKADLSKYRDASREVMAILCDFCTNVEKASIDEAYLDLSDMLLTEENEKVFDRLKSTFVVGYSSDTDGTKQWLKDIFDGGIIDNHSRNLARAALLVEDLRAAILEKTGFHCSAGISHNKILAKLACGLHKPNRQTVLPQNSVPILFENLPLKKVRNLGGKFGDEVNGQLDVKTIGQVTKFSRDELQQKFGVKSGTWLYNIARGIDTEPVKTRIISKSIGCCKNFKGYLALATKNDVKHWLAELCSEIYERIQDDLITNKRKATLLTVSAHREEDNSGVFSRSTALNRYNEEDITRKCYALVCKFNRAPLESPAWEPSLKFLGVSVSKFVPVADSSRSLLNFFVQKPQSASTLPLNEVSSPVSNDCETLEKIPASPSTDLVNSNTNATAAAICDDGESFFCAYFGTFSSNETAEQIEGATSDEKCVVASPKPIENVEKDSSSNESVDLTFMERCQECGQLVAIVDLPEHGDYHTARKLHEELNGIASASKKETDASDRTVAANRNVLSWTRVSAADKGKHKKSSRVRSDSTAAKNRQITSFFQAKQNTHERTG